ncbi:MULTISPECIES: FAD-dependent oxidoreductase [Nocardia]|uniref:FAD-dependent oxidoreductase n=1 Tax=Nocardia TaxID=1817 RepID=UPI00265950A2|nr:FAD-dependent oxidoreductase [Nocardia sp. PE-7]WKG08840.1 FAD-dependent oxidoreductase [Nocardia sp. PE-7]
MSIDVDVLVIGCGPAGISAADRLATGGARVLAVDAGRGHTVRTCPVDLMMACTGCRASCNVISGFGGCIHYGDGVKLSRFPSGRRLAELLGPLRAPRLESEALDALCGSPLPTFSGVAATGSPFPVKDYPVVSLTSEQVRGVIDRAEQRLTAAGVQVALRTEVSALRPAVGGGWQATLRGRRHKELVHADSVVVAVGRRGRSWWHRQIRDLGLGFTPPTPSVGVRFEGPAELLRGGALVHEDYKTTLTHAGVKIKTFCYCAGRDGGGGRIKFTDYPADGYTLLDGHVIAETGHDDQTVANFALLAQLRDETGQPWDLDRVDTELMTPYRKLRTDRPGKPVLQWFPDFVARRVACDSLAEFTRRSGVAPSVADYEMANLAAILPVDVHAALVATFTELADFFTGAQIAEYGHRIGVIGLELENTWDEMVLTPDLETTAPRLYAVGDCSGLAQGIVQAAVGGLAAAEHILHQYDLVKGLAG